MSNATIQTPTDKASLSLSTYYPTTGDDGRPVSGITVACQDQPVSLQVSHEIREDMIDVPGAKPEIILHINGWKTNDETVNAHGTCRLPREVAVRLVKELRAAIREDGGEAESETPSGPLLRKTETLPRPERAAALAALKEREAGTV